jgi:hypothetical protein
MIKNWNLFKESVDMKSNIREICKEYKIENYTINGDGTIDVDGDVDLSDMGLNEIPLKFGRVSGDFICSNNSIKSLNGCPQWVGGHFSCRGNRLTSLEFCPQWVGGNFFCYNNQLTSLEYIPKVINKNIACFSNNITSLIGINYIEGVININNNPIDEIWKLFESVKDIEFFNDCHIIREPETPDGLPIVIIERLNFFLETIGKDPVEKIEGYINI